MNIITGYNTILHKMSDIIKALKLNPGAREKLTSLYQQNEWLAIEESPVEDKLVRVALMRIEQDPDQFDLFIDMLCDIEGMDVIVNKLRGGELRCSLSFLYILDIVQKREHLNPRRFIVHENTRIEMY